MDNCRSFVSRLDALIQAGCKSIGVLMLELDRFQFVTEAIGHMAGEDLLTKVADRLTETAPPEGFWANFWGDKFFWRCRKLMIKLSCKKLHSISWMFAPSHG